MANKTVFAQTKPRQKAEKINRAGGIAYSMDPRAELAQYAMTGTFHNAFYTDAKADVLRVNELVTQVSDEFLAKLVILARQEGYMKDVPAFLLAVLFARSSTKFEATFPQVIDNGRMLRTFCQIVLSGAAGRGCKLGSKVLKRVIGNWLRNRTDWQLFRDSVGNDPSLADIIKLVHANPHTAERDALQKYLLGKTYEKVQLPQVVRDFEDFKAAAAKGEHGSLDAPNVEFRMLTSLALTEEHWKEIARNARWHQTRMNLNTFARHGVFNDKALTKKIADRLRNADDIKRAKVFPYQLFAAYKNISSDVPQSVADALHDAMEIAVENVPVTDGKVYIFPDVSGSMGASVTGFRGTATSAVRCVDAAAVIAAVFMRKNADAELMPFDTQIHKPRVSSRDTVITIAAGITKKWGGGTDYSLPIRQLNAKKAEGDLLIWVSDMQSWADSRDPWCGATQCVAEWDVFKKRNPDAKAVHINLHGYGEVQAPDDKSILNVAGFSDHVFSVIREFARGGFGSENWIERIEAVEV